MAEECVYYDEEEEDGCMAGLGQGECGPDCAEFVTSKQQRDEGLDEYSQGHMLDINDERLEWTNWRPGGPA